MIVLDLPQGAGPPGRWPGIAARRQGGRARPVPVEIEIFDHPDPDLLLVREGGRWRLERAATRGGWFVGPDTVATAATPEALGHGVDAAPRPRARLVGRMRRLRLAAAETGRPAPTLTVLDGTLGDEAARHPVRRAVLADGDDADLATLALDLIAAMGATPATAPLGAPLGAPLAPAYTPAATAALDAPPPAQAEPRPDDTVDDAIGAVLGSLGLALLHWAPRAASGAGDGHPVHQMRVTIRRLRSALTLFRAPLGGVLEPERAALRDLAAALGPARDWDVFLAGTAPAIEAALPDGRALRPVRRRAVGARDAAYASLRVRLAEPATRRLMAAMALLPFSRPWRAAPGAGTPAADAGDADAPGTDTPDGTSAAGASAGGTFLDDASGGGTPDGGGAAVAARRVADPSTTFGALAPALLDRRFRKLRRGHRSLAGLPPDTLHDIRKAAKTLRYALEFLAGTLPRRDVRRLARRLAALQDVLGAINDAATAGALMSGGGKGGVPAHGAGIVLGWLAAQGVRRRDDLEDLWRAVCRTDRFWRA